MYDEIKFRALKTHSFVRSEKKSWRLRKKTFLLFKNVKIFIGKLIKKGEITLLFMYKKIFFIYLFYMVTRKSIGHKKINWKIYTPKCKSKLINTC